MGAGIASPARVPSSIEDRSRSRSCSDSRREQSAFPIEKLRLILVSDEGLNLLLQFISKCSKDGKTVNYLSTLSSMSNSPLNTGSALPSSPSIGHGASGGFFSHFPPPSPLTTSSSSFTSSLTSQCQDFIASFLGDSHPSCLILLKDAHLQPSSPPTISIASSTSSSFSVPISPSTTHHPTTLLSILLTQLPQLFVSLAIGVFPEFLKSPEYDLWLRHEQLLIDTAEFLELTSLLSPAKTRGSVNDPRDGFEYLEKFKCVDFISLVSRPQWILALARSFDHLPFPICIHSSSPPHLFLYANEAFLTSGDFLSHREDLFHTSIDFLLVNPFDIQTSSRGAAGVVGGVGDSFPQLSYQQQYQHCADYEALLQQIRHALKAGEPSRTFLKITTKTGKVLYDLMTLIPVTNLYGEYTYMISVHCNYQVLMKPSSSASSPLNRRPHPISFRQSSHQEEEGGGVDSESESSQTHHQERMIKQTHSNLSWSLSELKLGVEQIQHLVLLENFIHSVPYRIHHTRYDNYLLVNSYLDEWRAAAASASAIPHEEEEEEESYRRGIRERHESNPSLRFRTTEDSMI
jgi:hypothetical protein